MSAPAAGSTAPDPAARAVAVGRFLDARRRVRRQRGVWDGLYRLYVGATFVGVPAWLLWSALQDALVPLTPAEAGWLLDPAPPLVVGVLLAATVGALRLSTWQGPVVLSKPDVAWLCAAPIPRRALLVGPLRRGLAAAALVPAAAGAVLGAVGTVRLAVPPAPLVLAAGGAGAGWGLTVAAAGWHVERDLRRARLVVRLSLVGWGLAAGLVGPALLGPALLGPDVLGSGPFGSGLLGADLLSSGAVRTVGVVALWSGPWGWAVAPLVAAAGGHAPGWPLAATAAVVLAGWLTVTADRTAGAVPAEELERRAGANTSFRAALFFGDLRTAALARREAVHVLRGVSRRRLPRPRSPALAVPWRDAVVLVRERGRLVAVAVAVAVAAAAASLVPPGPLSLGAAVTVAVAVAAGYAAAAALVEPLRTEPEQRFADHHLPWPARTVARAHLVVPVAVLVGLGVAALGVLAAAGAVPVAGLPAGLAVVVVGAVAVVACAAASAVAPAPDPSLLFAGEAAVQLFAVQLLVGPQIAAVAVLPPALVAVAAAGGGAPAAAVLLGAGLWTGLVAAAADAWVGHRVRKEA